MQAIQTKYHGPTNTKPSKLSAECAAGKIRVSYDHALSIDENHKAAARKLAYDLGWTDKVYPAMHGGHLSDGSMVWVFVCDYLKV